MEVFGTEVSGMEVFGMEVSEGAPSLRGVRRELQHVVPHSVVVVVVPCRPWLLSPATTATACKDARPSTALVRHVAPCLDHTPCGRPFATPQDP